MTENITLTPQAAEHIKSEMKKKKMPPISIDGMKEGKWVLLDFGDVIIAIFFRVSSERKL